MKQAIGPVSVVSTVMEAEGRNTATPSWQPRDGMLVPMCAAEVTAVHGGGWWHQWWCAGHWLQGQGQHHQCWPLVTRCEQPSQCTGRSKTATGAFKSQARAREEEDVNHTSEPRACSERHTWSSPWSRDQAGQGQAEVSISSKNGWCAAREILIGWGVQRSSPYFQMPVPLGNNTLNVKFRSLIHVFQGPYFWPSWEDGGLNINFKNK